ncbi:MAG: GNAT family N-acetyltransferase [Eubacteriales bacterium]|nr:GNAT family N-acetyltransferase [Eubacteriales bacterium]
MITMRQYADGNTLGTDYEKVRTFLLSHSEAGFTFSRWDWMVTHPSLTPGVMDKLGIWEEDGRIVGIAVVDCQPGTAFLCAQAAYAGIKEQMLAYARENLAADDGAFGVMIDDRDDAFQRIAAAQGYVATPEQERDAMFYPAQSSMAYSLPEGYRIQTLADELDLYHYGKVLWQGFDHEADEGPYSPAPEEKEAGERGMLRAHVDLSLKIAVVAPNGDFAAYCGMWYDGTAPYAAVEPVATAPQYRRMGLGKAAVLEGISRCAALGAKAVLVGSDQQFYYSLGFRPFATRSLWRAKKNHQ